MTDSSSRNLQGEMRSVETISADERASMHAIFAAHFSQTTSRQFENDLAEKDACIILRDGNTAKIQGFSTLQKLRVDIGGQPAIAIFSGDTIVNREHWGATELIKIWAQHVFGLGQSSGSTEVYWFLITSGYRTYRFLPVFFREFFPTYHQATPPSTKRLIDQLGELKFPGEYSPETGVIRLSRPTPLLSGISEVTPARLTDPHIQYFVRANPGHADGDELACLTRIDYANLTRAGRRLFPAQLSPSLGTAPLTTSGLQNPTQ